MAENIYSGDVPYESHRVAYRSGPYDGCPFWLTLVRGVDGIVQHQWAVRFGTELEARAAAEALIATGSAYSVLINNEMAIYHRRRS